MTSRSHPSLKVSGGIVVKPLEISWADECDIEIEHRAPIEDALRGIVRHSDPSAGESAYREEGKWPPTVESVEVCRSLTDGRSGARVLEIITRRAGRTRPALQVAKLMNVTAAIDEWAGYRRLRETCDSNLFVAITAVSQGVFEQRKGDSRQNVVVYRHATEWHHGKEDVAMVSLEDVIASTLDNGASVEECVDLVGQVLSSLAGSMYEAGDMQEQGLLSFNASLGFDVSLSVGQATGTSEDLLLMDGNADNDSSERRLHSAEAIVESTSPPGPARTLVVGDTVRLTLKNLEVGEEVVTGTLLESGVTVHVKLLGSSKADDNLKLIREAQSRKRDVEILGNVTAVRAQTWSAAMARAFKSDGFNEGELTISYEGTRVSHPARHLHSILSKSSAKRSFSPVHCDLNPRNIIILGSMPYLIDFATFKKSDATLQDPAWLETCLIRDCFADRLSWNELIRISRFLGFLSRMSAFWGEAQVRDAAALIAQALSEDNQLSGPSLHILWRVRSALAEAMPESALGDWRTHYPQHLVLAACRTMKWADEPHERENLQRLRASCAVAGVAGESLGPLEEQFADWTPADASLACQALLDAGPGSTAGAGDLLLAASAAVDDAAVLRRVVESLRRDPSPRLQEARRELFDRNRVGTDAAPGKAKRPDSLRGQAADSSFTYIAMEGHRLPPGAPCVQQGLGALSAESEDCVTLIEREPRAVLLSDPSAGKTTVARELYLRRLSEDVPASQSPLLPLWVSAVDVMEFLRGSKDPKTVHRFLRVTTGVGEQLGDASLAALIAMGAVHVTVDGLHLVDGRERGQLMVYLTQIARRTPSLGLLVCDRIRDYAPAVLGWPAVAVHKVREEPARDFLRTVLRKRDEHSWKKRFKNLEERLFRDVGAVALRDLAGKPQFLSMLVDHYAGTDILPSEPGELVRHYLIRLLQDEASASNVDCMIQRLGQIAKKLDASGALRKTDAIDALDAVEPGSGANLLQELLRTPCLDEVAGRVSFRDPLVQSYCGAIALQRLPETEREPLTDYVLRYGWREAAVLLVTDPKTSVKTTEAVVRAAVNASPWYGAVLLQAAPTSGVIDCIRDGFLREHKDVLRAGDSGLPAWKRSAYALAKYGDGAALDILRDVALNATVATEAAETALDGLVMMHRWFAPGAAACLREVLRTFLDPLRVPASVDARLITRALRSIQVARLHDNVGLAWDRIAADQPWEVLSQAWETVTHLRVQPDRARTRLYVDACCERLHELDQLLRSTAATERVDELNTERIRLLRQLATCGQLETLLAHRFRVGLADYRDWPQLIEEAVAAQHALQGEGAAVSTLLLASDVLTNIGIGADHWTQLLAMESDSLKALAAHHLLAGNVDIDETCLQSLVESGTPKSLMIASAFVHSLPQEMCGTLATVLDPYLDDLDGESLEAVAALVGAAEHLDADTGRRLAWRVHRALLAQGLDEAALHWPWATTWRRALLPRAETGDFLAEHEESLVEGVHDRPVLTLLGSADVVLDAPAVKPVPLPLNARRQLLKIAARTNPSGVAGHRFVLLAASTGLYEELAFVQQAAFDPYNQATAIRHSHGVHGSMEVRLAAHAIAAIGYLTRLKAQDDPGYKPGEDMDEVAMIDAEVIDSHPSLARARIVSLGYWSVDPLLDALPSEDPILLSALKNIVHHWLPGSVQEADARRKEIASRLLRATTEMPLTPQARGVLTELRLSIEDRLGRYVSC
ncbi:hypothetical protein ACFWFU_03295 [Streptomyces sp. NPDC060235]|uniref:hypothetical protein n=1 Tax=Streptomyces sp. NPDC060235 TaxID=3347080 RepID=UPI003657721A